MCSCALFRCDGSELDMTHATLIPLRHDVPLEKVFCNEINHDRRFYNDPENSIRE